jgi:TetR/AcrR family transcriptional repressor of nem operon
MARGIGFDYEKAIDRATRLFWKKGYSNTSTRELQKVMGIGYGSFYNTVKSKQNLYLECLKHYLDTVGRKRGTALFSEPSIKLGVRALFRTILDELDDPKSPRLCLMAGSVSCDVLEIGALRRFIFSQTAAFEDTFVERLKSAQAAGELTKQFEPKVVVQIISIYIHGLFRAALIAYDRKESERQTEVFLKGLGL